MTYNRDGNSNNDMQDDFLDYKIYKKSVKSSSENPSECKSTFFAIIIILGVVLFFGVAIGLGECKNASDDYDSSTTGGSSYWREGGSSSYKGYGDSGSSNSAYSGSSNAQSYGNSTPMRPYSYKPSKSTKKLEDPYNAKGYSYAEDFYDDNYDDFYDYEDAEDYYDDWGE